MIKDRLKEALIPAFITLAVFMGVLLAKGIFPFGDLRIDYYDMGQTNAPLYYHIWDFLHGKGGLFYSWYIDEGQNLSMGSSIQWNISVFNLFFLFIKRSAVMKSLSIFMGLHLFFMAFNMNLFLRHTVDTPRFYRILFSIAYGLTGFTLTHYTIPTYLDTAALMPLYLITLHDALAGRRYHGISEGNKKNAGTESPGGAESPLLVDIKLKTSKSSLLNPVTLYALMTAYMTALGYYMAFMNLIFVLLVSGTYIFILCGRDRVGKTEKKTDSDDRAKCAAAGENASNDSGRADVLETEKESQRRAVGEGVMEAQGRTDAPQTEKESRRRAVGEAATRLGIGTFAGIGLSSFILLPAALQMMKSSRFNSNLSGGFGETMHDILWAIGADMYYIKWWLLSGSIAAIVILLCGMIRFRREVRQNIFCFLFCMYPCALIVFESINLLWHMGTYYHYPIRCGYLIPIVLLTTAAYYAGKFSRDYVNIKTDLDPAGNSDASCDITTNYVNKSEGLNPSVNINSGSNDNRDYVNSAGTDDPTENSNKTKDKGINYVNPNKSGLIILSVICVIAAAALILYYDHHPVWQIEELFRAWTVFALILAAAYFVIWAILKRPVYIAPLLIMELIVTAYAGYGQPRFVDRFSSDPEQSGDYVVAAQMLKDGLGIRESRTERIKNPDTTLNTNYGFIMRRATVGGWANTVPGPQMDSAIALGYGAHFMRILDCGGSLLSDAALHVTETLTLKPDLYTDEAWETEGEREGYVLLKNKFTLPFVMKTADPGEDNA
ncbi:MAG: YfhO family protein, partial [Lachnospiraceae bacterium]|nr:YfhO family protein [Lachnospiraceae bacterium]